MTKKLTDYTEQEWEAICNQCGKCCLIKLQDEDRTISIILMLFADIWILKLVAVPNIRSDAS